MLKLTSASTKVGVEARAELGKNQLIKKDVRFFQGTKVSRGGGAQGVLNN